MFGNLLNNNEIIECESKNFLKIKPWEPNKLQPAHYPLNACVIHQVVDPGKSGAITKPIHTFQEGDENNEDKAYPFEANDYFVVEIFQSITLSPGIVGKFVVASNLIEKGFSLTGGKITYPFGEKREVVRFGIKNLLSVKNYLMPFHKIAYIEFFDMRGLNNLPYNFSDLTPRDIEIYLARKKKAEIGGVDYGDGT